MRSPHADVNAPARVPTQSCPHPAAKGAVSMCGKRDVHTPVSLLHPCNSGPGWTVGGWHFGKSRQEGGGAGD